jgi:hypothetical protein
MAFRGCFFQAVSNIAKKLTIKDLFLHCFLEIIYKIRVVNGGIKDFLTVRCCVHMHNVTIQVILFLS